MTPKEYLEIHPDACTAGSEYAIQFATMAEVWDACERPDWLLWMAGRVPVKGSTLVGSLCRLVRETPLGDGRTVWDLLTDPRSRKAVEVSERHAAGLATDRELRDACDAADAARASAYVIARAARADRDAANAASYAASYAAYAAARCADRDAAAAYAASAARAAYAIARDAGHDRDAARAAFVKAEAAQCRIIREEIPNPFTP